QALAVLARSSHTLGAVVEAVHAQAGALFPAQVTMLALLQGPQEWLWEVYEGEQKYSCAMPFYEEGILEQVLLHGPLSIPDLDAYLGQYPARVRRVPDAGEIPVYPAPVREDPLEDDVKAILAVPLEVAGERVGVLSVQGYRAWAFDPTDLDFLELLGQHVSIALENARLRGELEHAALSDPLTGLSNRRAFTARAGRAMTGPCPQGTPRTLVVLDVQQFKRFNDDLGHDVGDAVLIGLARLLQEVTGARGEVFRLGGDEFALLLRGGEETAVALVQELLGQLDAWPWPGGVRQVRINAGIAPGSGQASLDDWLRCADLRMYRAKRERRLL
ncbi:MAG: GGDEF domain-containing protein, partial [Deinococcus sp.]